MDIEKCAIRIFKNIILRISGSESDSICINLSKHCFDGFRYQCLWSGDVRRGS
jgi:hypothetical protein